MFGEPSKLSISHTDKYVLYLDILRAISIIGVIMIPIVLIGMSHVYLIAFRVGLFLYLL